MAESEISAQNDLLAKISHYEDQFKQVDAALAISPSHEDLLSIKKDLQEILKILNSQIGDNSVTNEKAQTGSTGEKVQTETASAPAESIKKLQEKEDESVVEATFLSFPNDATLNLDVKKEESSNRTPPVPTTSTTTTSVTPGIDDYLKFREIERKFEQRARLKQFISLLVPAGTDVQGQSISIVHMNFREVPQPTLRNLLRNQKQKIRRLELNAEREAKGLPPIPGRRNGSAKKRKYVSNVAMQSTTTST